MNIPNTISFLRVILSPIFYIYIIRDDVDSIRIACLIYLVAAVSDYFDGWIARKYNEVTSLGKFFDPLADKFLTTAAFLAFVQMGFLPLWMVIIIIIRDLGTTLLRIYADAKEESIVTSFSAKVKTFIQMSFITVILGIILLKASLLKDSASIDLNSFLFSDYIYYSMLVLTALTVWTAIEYVFQNKKVFRLLLHLPHQSNAS